MGRGTGAAWGSLALGLASVATLPVAVWATRFSDAYELLHAGFAIPVAGVLGLLALSLSRRSRRVLPGLRPHRGARVAGAGRVLGIVGVCLAVAGLVALGTYALLDYAGSRD